MLSPTFTLLAALSQLGSKPPQTTPVFTRQIEHQLFRFFKRYFFLYFVCAVGGRTPFLT